MNQDLLCIEALAVFATVRVKEKEPGRKSHISLLVLLLLFWNCFLIKGTGYQLGECTAVLAVWHGLVTHSLGFWTLWDIFMVLFGSFVCLLCFWWCQVLQFPGSHNAETWKGDCRASRSWSLYFSNCRNDRAAWIRREVLSFLSLSLRDGLLRSPLEV